MKKTTKHYHEAIRKPTAPPTKVFGAIRDYKREQNYLEIDSYLEDISEKEDTLGTEEERRREGLLN
jgi:hypothetical protein